MKTDLATAIIATIAGVVAGFFVTSIVLPALEDVSFKTLDSSVNITLVEPNVETFNFRAVNPTVEVYIGECTRYDENGKCLDDNYIAPEDLPEEYEEETPDEEENGDTD